MLVSLRSMLGYDFERQLCSIAPKVSVLTSDELLESSLIDRSIIEALTKYQKHEERIRKVARVKKRADQQMLNMDQDNVDSQVKFNPEVKIRTYDPEKLESYTDETINTEQEEIQTIKDLFANSEEDDSDNNETNPLEGEETIVDIIESASGKSIMHMYNAINMSLQGYSINEEIISLFTQLLAISDTVTSKCFQILKTYYPIYMHEIQENDKSSKHFKIAKEIAKKALKYIEPKIRDLKKEKKLEIINLIHDTVCTDNLEQLEKQYLKICVYCDILLAAKDNRIITEKDLEKGNFELKKTSEVSEVLGIERDNFSNRVLAKQISVENLYKLPSCFLYNFDSTTDPKNVFVIKNEHEAPEKIDLQNSAQDMAASYAAIMNAAAIPQQAGTNNFVPPKINYEQNIETPTKNIVTVREEEYASILRMLIRQMCNNGIYKEKSKTIYDSKIFQVLEMLTPFIELQKGLIDCTNENLDNTHISDIIKYRSILYRRIYSLKQLQKTLNNEVSNCIKDRDVYDALENQVTKNHITGIRDILDVNQNPYGFQEMDDVCAEFNAIVVDTSQRYNNSLLNNPIVKGAVNPIAIGQIIRNEHVGNFIENVCRGTQELYRINSSQRQASVVNYDFRHLYRAINILIQKENHAQHLIEKFKNLPYREQMETDIYNYEEMRKKAKIQKIINFYLEQIRKIENYIQKSKCIAVKETLKTIEKNLGINLQLQCEPRNFEVKSNYRTSYNTVTRKSRHTLINNPQPDKYWDYYRQLCQNIKNTNEQIFKPEICDAAANINKLKLYEMLFEK